MENKKSKDSGNKLGTDCSQVSRHISYSSEFFSINLLQLISLSCFSRHSASRFFQLYNLLSHSIYLQIPIILVPLKNESLMKVYWSLHISEESIYLIPLTTKNTLIQLQMACYLISCDSLNVIDPHKIIRTVILGGMALLK